MSRNKVQINLRSIFRQTDFVDKYFSVLQRFGNDEVEENGRRFTFHDPILQQRITVSSVPGEQQNLNTYLIKEIVLRPLDGPSARVYDLDSVVNSMVKSIVRHHLTTEQERNFLVDNDFLSSLVALKKKVREDLTEGTVRQWISPVDGELRHIVCHKGARLLKSKEIRIEGMAKATGNNSPLVTPNNAYSDSLPTPLRDSLEYLSGQDLSDVQVHYNSLKPAIVQAAAYACGPEIFLAPGAEQYLPHESWHVVQQKQGRVESHAIINEHEVNNDPELEKEAEIMGALAAALSLASDAGYIDFFASQNLENSTD